MDFHTAELIAESNSDSIVEPASITKLMTSYVVFHALNEGLISLDDNVRVSEKAWRTGGSRMYIEVGTEVSVEDLLRGMIIQSGNDASIALAEHVAGSEESFVSLMNEYAQALGMENSHFENATPSSRSFRIITISMPNGNIRTMRSGSRIVMVCCGVTIRWTG
jgi:D-alanyl-D-alanine carboxypeptidase (penicillin-binding protein 5/6)